MTLRSRALLIGVAVGVLAARAGAGEPPCHEISPLCLVSPVNPFLPGLCPDQCQGTCPQPNQICEPDNDDGCACAPTGCCIIEATCAGVFGAGPAACETVTECQNTGPATCAAEGGSFDANASCSSPSGSCVAFTPTSTPTAVNTPTPSPTPTGKRPNGDDCGGSDQCLSGNCVDDVCCDKPCNAAFEVCDQPRGTCTVSTVPAPTASSSGLTIAVLLLAAVAALALARRRTHSNR